jgi:enoyl-CoA hydratase/carnithine racemase
MSTVKHEVLNEISIITLTGGVTNPINPKTTNELLEILDSELGKGLILTSGNTKFFSIGFDLPSLLKLDIPQLTDFYNNFNELCLKLFTLQRPTLAAISGHCVAAGCIIAACTDYRLIAEGNAKLGITATKLGLPVPYLASRIIHQVLNDIDANDLISTGELFDINWAKRAQYIDEIKSADSLFISAQEIMKKLIGQENMKFKETKKSKTKSIEDAYFANKEQDANNFINKWFTPEVQLSLKDAVKKF